MNKILRNVQNNIITIKNILIFIGNTIIELIKSLMDLFIKIFKYFHKNIKNIKKSKVKIPKTKWVPRYSEVKKAKQSKKVFVKLKYFLLGILFTVTFVVIPIVVRGWFLELPSPDLLVTRTVSQPTRILDRNGRLLYEIYIDKRFEPVKLTQIPEYVIDATIAVEDDEFYTHKGYNLKSMIRAAESTIIQNELQGGSTITQQLVKNVLLTPERTISRKIKELVLSVLVEAKYSKDEILEMYLNNISYGGSAWGIQSASQKYFGKDVWELDLAEGSLLAGLPTAPSVYSPLQGDTSKFKARQRYVLDRMVETGAISETQAQEAFNEEISVVPQTEYIRAPHFVAYVRNDLEEKYGKRYVELGGLTITTTLDLDLQDEVQQIVTEEVGKYGWLNITNGAAVVLDSQKAEILAYVGSIDYFKEGWGAFDVATSFRQPGSSIKPLTYALALESGFTPASIIEDKPITYNIPGQKPYSPKNYDNRYHGIVTLRQALANSYNIPAVKVAEKVGPDNIVALGKKLGLSNWEVDGSYGLAITLGGKEVRLLDHANLFATFARLGEYREVTPYLSIVDSRGYETYQDNRENNPVVSQAAAYIIYDILSDSVARLPAFGTRNFLTVPGKKIAVKTGTTDNIRDNFTMGFTPSYTVGVWVGNNDNTPLNSRLASGLSGAAPIWNRIMTTILADKPNEVIARPASVFEIYDEKCNKREIFIKGTNVPKSLCIDKDDKDDKDDKENNDN